jgi:hypothetical protein
MPSIFGLLSSRGGRSLVGLFGGRYGDAVADDVGPTKNLSSIRMTVIRSLSPRSRHGVHTDFSSRSSPARAGVGLDEEPSCHDAAIG